MNEAGKLRKAFNEALHKLQEECEHPETEWMPYMWAPGHFGDNVLVCSRCDRILEKEKTRSSASTMSDEK